MTPGEIAEVVFFAIYGIIATLLVVGAIATAIERRKR